MIINRISTDFFGLATNEHNILYQYEPSTSQTFYRMNMRMIHELPLSFGKGEPQGKWQFNKASLAHPHIEKNEGEALTSKKRVVVNQGFITP